MKTALLCATALVLSAPGITQVQINEIRTGSPGQPDDAYFELVGPPGMPLNGITYLVIGDDGGSSPSGVVEHVTHFSGVILDPGLGLFAVADVNGNFLPGGYLLSALNFEEDDNVTHLLVTGSSALVGQDLDTNDDGVLDVMPWGTILDGVALVQEDNPPSTTEYHYANLPGVTAMGPLDGEAPKHVIRCGTDWRLAPQELYLFPPFTATDTLLGGNVCDAVYDNAFFCLPTANSVSVNGSRLDLVSPSGGSIAANDSVLVVTDTPDEIGLFAQSLSMTTPVTTVYGANLCLGPAGLQRLSPVIQASGHTASYALDFTSTGPESAVFSGALFYYQWYHRDTTPGGANLSRGMRVVWFP